MTASAGGLLDVENLRKATEFLRVVLPEMRKGEVYRAEGWPPPDPFADNFVTVEALANYVLKNGETSNMYFCPVIFQSAGKGRKTEAVSRVRVVWCDLDCGPGKPFATKQEARACIRRFLLKPRYVISSGRGIHVYWLLAEPVDADGFADFMAIVRGLAHKLGGDPKACLRTQLLRVPGTMNIDSVLCKKDGVDYPVEILEDNPGAGEYSLSDFEEAGVIPFPEVSHERTRSSEQGDYPESDLSLVVDGCAWMRHCRDDAATLPESEWYAALSIVGRCVDGERLAHEWSHPYPKYDPRGTDRKLAHALEDSGPRTCADIEINQGGRKYCDACPHKGRVKSPVVLGLPPSSQELGVPPYPVHALPQAVRRFVDEGALAVGVVPDMIGVHLVTLAGGVLGNKVSLVVKPGSWIEFPRLWSALIAPPGSAKSPALAVAMIGVTALQRTAAAKHQFDLKEYEDALKAWNDSKDHDRGPKPEEPRMRHYYTTDATPESLAPMLSSSRGVIIVNDELVGWVKGMDQYKSGKGRERQGHLQLWAGQDLKIDRKGQPTILVSNPVICVLGGIQPDVLRELSDDIARADGFLDRFLWSYPKQSASYWSDADIGIGTRTVIEDLFRDLSTLEGEFVFSPDAKLAWSAWYNGNQDITTAEHGLMKGVAAKLPVQLARVALVLHCLRFPSAPPRQIDVETLNGAIAVVEYHREHARKAFASLKGGGGRATSLRDRIVKLLAEGVSSVSSHEASEGTMFRSHLSMDWWPRSAFHGALGGRVPAADLGAALEELLLDGVVERQIVTPTGPRGGRPSEQFRLVTVRRN